MTNSKITGKTKEIIPLPGLPGHGKVFSFDDLTAENGARKITLAGKGALVNAITCDVFECLAFHRVPLAFVRREGDQFITRLAEMIPLEVVVRNKATGSALKRNTDLIDGAVIDPPVVEFFYKTTGKEIDGHELPEDDPLAVLQENGDLWLYHPGKPPVGEPIHIIKPPNKEVGYFHFLFQELTDIALRVNFYLKRAWEQQGGDLWDFKIECGEVDGRIVVADVIDFDSWRVFVNGNPVSKQLFRDKAPEKAILAAAQLTARMTKGFSI